MPRVLLFALIVLMSHVLEVKPSTVDAAGVKIAVQDVVVIRGGIALIFYYYFWAMISAWTDVAFFFPIRSPAHKQRNLIANYKRRIWDKRKGKVVPAKTKKYVRSLLRSEFVIVFPFIIIRMYIVIAALVVALPDVLLFGKYLYQQIPST